MELVANVYAVTGMERHTIWLLFCVSGVPRVAGVKMCPGFGWRLLSTYHCIQLWRAVDNGWS